MPTKPLPVLLALPAAGAGFLAAQVLRAAHRSDLPSFPNQEASGTFGDPSLPPLRIVAVGDSSLTAPGVRSLDNIWIRRVALRFSARHRVELISLGVGGSKACDVIEGQLEEAVRLAPDIAVVSVGSNDAIRTLSARRFGRRLDHIIGRLEETSSAVMVLGMGDLGSIPRLPGALRPYLTRRARLFDSVTREVVLTHPRAVKVYTGGRITSAFWEDRSLFAEDLFHAGDGGHAVFAREAWPAFEAAYLLATDGHRPGRDHVIAHLLR
jgi:lysophospholipase L1-like esterase